jgi:hypothetical protein
MIEHALDSDWWTATDWSSDEVKSFTIDGTGAVEFTWAAAEPAAAAAGTPIDAGLYQIARPLAGLQLYMRVTSGTADVYYASKDGPRLSETVSGHAYSGDAGADEDFLQTALPSIGFDDLTTRTGANPYEFRGYLTTPAADLASTADLQYAMLVLRLVQWIPNRTIRVYGIKYSSDQSGNITDWDTLDNRTKTTAYKDATTGTGPFLSFDVLAIVDELLAVSGWGTTSPIQFFIEDTGSALTDADARAIVDLGSADTRLTMMLTSGEPVPDPDIGGP